MAATAQVGDIVHVSEAAAGLRCRWVVLGFVSSGQGRDAKLVRKNAHGTYSNCQKRPEILTLVERPVFRSGDKVSVDGNRGVFMSREADGAARVMLAARRKQFTGIGLIEIQAAVARMNYALFVIENRKL
ncbi:hypothetical protein GCM10010869_09550 [Mesorhizobium tianshanense]|uniref:Uncharacterized protein n=1 Tax=Mesorhizobium tianshanense TaxID=39844 RepID=A0A562NLN3_9HYPH|nr:hypothetical protein [Mesorhizobium tianshanense]TWI33043.1 hypothetical protein IQ26_04252 [Mesorhizobium tianshanense]GLS35367.1 hypothetical protein GCM10010869_09550 [Mesorhizobium tianshanense]